MLGMAKTYSLSQLVQEANSLLTKEGLEPSWNERLVRHYTSEKKVLTPPSKEGREARYNETHLEQLLSLRRAQKLGITATGFDNALKYSTNLSESSIGATQARSMISGKAESLSSTLRATGSAFNATANASSVIPKQLPETSQVQENALMFLRGLGSTGKEVDILEQVTQAVQLPASTYPAQNAPESWLTWEIQNGVRLNIRTDVYDAFGSDVEKSLIEAIKTIRKSKP